MAIHDACWHDTRCPACKEDDFPMQHHRHRFRSVRGERPLGALPSTRNMSRATPVRQRYPRSQFRIVLGDSSMRRASSVWLGFIRRRSRSMVRTISCNAAAPSFRSCRKISDTVVASTAAGSIRPRRRLRPAPVRLNKNAGDHALAGCGATGQSDDDRHDIVPLAIAAPGRLARLDRN